jgi:hypothetical protein
MSNLSVVLRADKLVGSNGDCGSSKNAKAGSAVPTRFARVNGPRRYSSSMISASNSAMMRILDRIDRCYDVSIPLEHAR